MALARRIQNGSITIEVLVLGALENNVYIIGDGATTLVVDPSCKAQLIVEALGGRQVDSIVLTHAHWDHVGAARELRDATGARAVASAVDAPFICGEEELDPSHRQFTPCPVDLVVEDGDVVSIGAMEWKVLLTPGHTPGSMCLFLDAGPGSADTAPILVSGDTLFAGTHGRTDFVGGNIGAMRDSLARLAKLPDDTIVLPGHNALTTIAREKTWMPR